ncbi:DDT domain-containing protein DDR4 [Andrographis paniculata]|uniref:DDT domain-containing protein DDR4 n=1 Tax=Andrographis paniculata TaxID=175694 RepID=UPI0021E7FA4C|nr:DDT domain-containing protein DDR4 [Andrographis paniculata]
MTTEARGRPAATGGNMQMDDVVVTSPPSKDVEAAQKSLRQRWELASVLNFLRVFEPVIESDMKITAEEIEIALIEQNRTLAELHIALLKGILPSGKSLKGPDDWMIAVSKTLSEWWPWVGQGDFPLSGAKGNEISLYKKLDPTSRLLVLKALCEVRADEYDAVSYINDAIKNGSAASDFRKDKLAGDGNKISFWFEGSETIGYRLYKEVKSFENERVKGRTMFPRMNYLWETLATNLEEFKIIENKFSSSGDKLEVAVSDSIAADIIPLLEKQLKKKMRAHKRKQRAQMLLNGFRNCGITRSCRRYNKPVDYTFDNYDKSIKEAIQFVNKKRTKEVQNPAENQSKRRKRMGNTSASSSSNSDATLMDGECWESDEERDNKDGEYEVEKDDDKDVNVEQGTRVLLNSKKPKGSRFSKRLAGHGVPVAIPEKIGAKNRSRQRPNVNTAALVVPDSEEEIETSSR